MPPFIERLVDRQVRAWRLRQAALLRQLAARRRDPMPGLQRAKLRAASASAALEPPPKSGVRHRIPTAPSALEEASVRSKTAG
jgi:hypothetical protein